MICIGYHICNTEVRVVNWCPSIAVLSCWYANYNDMESNDFSPMEGTVPVELYRRVDCGLSLKSIDAITRGLPASLFMVHVKKDAQIVGMASNW